MFASDLLPRVAHMAAVLHERGARHGQVVAAMTESTALLATLPLATAALGCACFPLDPQLPPEISENLLEQAGVALVVSDSPWPARHGVATHELAGGSAAPLPASRLDSQHIALLVATSGSSGQPKAVMLTAGNLRASALASAQCTPLKAGDRWLACMPLFHIGGFSILSRCHLAGADAVLESGFEPQRVLDTLRQQAISHISLVPTMLAKLLDLGATPPPTLRHVLVGGAALPAGLAARAAALGWPIQPTYGMSETASQIATLPSLPTPWRGGHVGRPLAGVEIDLGEDGRLRVRGPMLMAGYANPALEPGDGLENGWFVSNDLAEINAEGELTILGRADDVIVSGGKKLHPAVVESRLAACPGLQTTAVFGFPDALWGEVVSVVFSGEISAEELLAWCRQNLPAFMRPRRAIRLDALPTLANGKLDRRALQQLVVKQESEAGTATE